MKEPKKPKKFARREGDQVTPEEKIYPLRFIVDYVMEKRNFLLSLESQSMHQALDIQNLSEEIMQKGRRMYGNPSSLPPEQKQMFEMLKKQQALIEELTVGLTRKGLAFEDMDNMIRQAQPFIMRLMFRDTLTDTYNRYFFISRSADLLAEAAPKVGFSLAFLDIDDFKQCNDVYGHEFGDEALRYLCKTVNDCLRKRDHNKTYFVRMGGDEFILISNELDFPHFVMLLDDLQRMISSGTVRWEDISGKIKVSIGAANTVFSKIDTPWDLYGVADERLYEAKRAGKNKIICS